MSIEQLKVPADTLSRTFGPDDLQFETTDEIETLVGTVG